VFVGVSVLAVAVAFAGGAFFFSDSFDVWPLSSANASESKQGRKQTASAMRRFTKNPPCVPG